MVAVVAPPDGSRCYICRKTIALGNDQWALYDDAKGVAVVVCERCIERGDVQETLDMTEDEFDIEGQPEFNGAFG